MAEGMVKELTVQFERAKAQVRARVEHPFASALRRCPSGCLRQAISLRAVHSLFALVNLSLARRSLRLLPFLTTS